MSGGTKTRVFFGGSFDPPHLGHVLAAAWVLATQDVDELLVVPVLEHAFGKQLAPFPDRLRMCELAFGGLRGARVSALEARLGGASYTIRTLRELDEPGWRLRMMVGSDLVAQLPSWREGDAIVELAPPLVVGRGGHAVDAPAEQVMMPEVSSTEVRERIAEGRTVDHVVSRRVAAHIEAHRLYR